MIPIKIQCECGQRYAFDVEPVHARMPYPVTCPACGVDGTAAANELIAQNMPVEVAASPAKPAAVADAPAVIRVSSTRSSPRRITALPGEMDRSQAQHEARAKILWGDAPDEVVRFLMGQGIPVPEASAIVDELFRERAATIRRDGIVKMFGGSLLVCVPIVAWFIFNSIGYIWIKLFAFMVLAGFYGIWLVIKGATLFFSPRSASGDAAAQ